MIPFFLFLFVFHSMQFWLWRVYLKEHKDAYERRIPTQFESMLFWPQFLGIMKGKQPWKNN